MSEVCNRNISKAMELARQLTILADEGELLSQDDGCAVLYCVIRDCAYKIRSQAEREREAHRQAGVWRDVAGGASGLRSAAAP